MAKEQTYQELNDQLEAVLAQLQSEDVDIDESMELYQRGQKLVEQLESRLSEVENKITEHKPKRTN